MSSLALKGVGDLSFVKGKVRVFYFLLWERMVWVSSFAIGVRVFFMLILI